MYYYARTYSPICPENKYPYTSGSSGIYGTCRARSCSNNKTRIKISGNRATKTAMQPFLGKFGTDAADFNPYVIYAAVKTDAFVKLAPSRDVIAEASGR